jgi:hypothetical protein
LAKESTRIPIRLSSIIKAARNEELFENKKRLDSMSNTNLRQTYDQSRNLSKTRSLKAASVVAYSLVESLRMDAMALWPGSSDDRARSFRSSDLPILDHLGHPAQDRISPKASATLAQSMDEPSHRSSSNS